MLGERDQVSAEVAAAQMLGYRNELIRQQRGRGGQMPGAGPRVREPEGGFGKDKLTDREMYRKRQAAGGGVTSENIAVQERDWQLTVASLFARPRQPP
jgi:CDK-activating kinase assembly factor MAT1